MKRKAFLADFLLYFVFIFVLGLAFIAIYYASDTINTAWQATPNLPDISRAMVADNHARFISIWDTFFLFIVIGLFISVLILAFSIRSHPVFAMLSFFALIIFGILAVHFSNAFDDFARSGTISEAANAFTLLPFIMTRLPHIVVILGIVFIIVLYGKTRQSDIGL